MKSSSAHSYPAARLPRVPVAFTGLIILALLLSSCGSLWGNYPQDSGTSVPPVISQGGPPTLTPFQPEGFTPPPTETVAPPPGEPTYTSAPLSLWVSPAVPSSLRQSALASEIAPAASPEAAAIRLDALNSQASLEIPAASTWYYALVAPFPTVTDNVALVDIRNAWAGNPSGPFAGRPLWMEASTLEAFTSLWGAPASGAVSVAPAETLIDSAWAARPAWALVPFEALDPHWKVLSVDGQSPVRNDFDSSAYSLKVNFALQPAVFSLPPSNRDPNKLTVLAMTGVTALVRATADQMEQHGVLYPGEEVRTVLRAADLTHISNEIPFDAACPTPNPWTDSLVFCSDPSYIALLEDVGTDVVELTGNHLLDYGQHDATYTIDMYSQRGWLYYGGGRDLADSIRPAMVTHNGNKLAFLGCNYAGPPGDLATESSPGSTPCDLDRMKAQIADLRSQGYLPIVTFQYYEYYQFTPSDYEQRDFREMADAGAVIVSGSQCHMPAAMEFDGKSMIHYGLGNLFFDQMSHLMPDGSLIYDTRDLFIDRHVFYDGKYLGTELLSYVNEDYARPRLMTESERTHFLETIFGAAGW